MSGIVGYLGKKEALPILIEGLKRERYKGYDSAGVVVLNEKEAVLVKAVGNLENLEKKLKGQKIEGKIGLGHLRWASHGKVKEKNTHPLFDCKKEIFLVHNGIIENYKELKEKLIKEGHKFSSETDSEVISHLVEKYFRGNLEEAVRKTIKEIRGAYAFALVSKKELQKIVATKISSPLFLGIGKDEFLIASEPTAILIRTKKVINLEDGEIAVLKPNDFYILKEKPVETIEWDLKDAERGPYPHFMIKEIFEGPEAIENAMKGRLVLEKGTVKFGGLDPLEEKLKKVDRVVLIGCGSSFYAAKIGETMFQEYAGLEARAEIASEFRLKKQILDKNTVIISVSQSGETSETLAVLREIKKKGILNLGITNVVGSSQTKETEAGIYLRAGPEIAVASTKTFLAQIVVLAMLTVYFGRQREMSLATGRKIISELLKIPNFAKEVLKRSFQIERLAKKYRKFKNFYLLGRKYNFPVALEGALKLKEVTYLHAEGIAGGELRHGPMALIDKNFLTIALCPLDSVYDKMISTLREVKQRKGSVLAIATKGDNKIKKLADEVIYIPKTLEMLTPIISVIPLHLFAYYLATFLGREVDRPRNLTKSVRFE